MAEVIRPDICVIGAGSGGLRVASEAAAFGVPVALVEKRDLAEVTLEAGRLPLAALIAAANCAHAVTDAPGFGIRVESPVTDFTAVRSHMKAVIAARAPNVTRARLIGFGVRLIEGGGRFKDHETLLAGDDFEIKARRFVIATGSSPALPPVQGLETTPHLTPETVPDLASLPSHLLVLGAGSDGLEFAQAFRRLGSKVTVLDSAAPLPDDDPECTAAVLDALAREGVVVRGGLTLTRVQPRDGSVHVIASGPGGEELIAGSHLLVTGARWANVVGLGLEAAGIAFDERGIAVDRALRTRNKRVYAIGDVTGAPRAAQAAEAQAGLVVRDALFRRGIRFDPFSVPRVMLTDPELAQVGVTEAEARRRGGAIRVLRWPFREIDRAYAGRATAGHIKVVTARRGRILGVTIVGTGAGELLAPWTLALGQRLGIDAFAGIEVPYPALAEVGKRAAQTYFAADLTSARVQRIIHWLRRLG